jgi:Bacterial dnaA protein helix-turn-helix
MVYNRQTPSRQEIVDPCHTADDVLRRAADNHRFRQRMYPKPPPIRYVPPPKPKPESKPKPAEIEKPRPLPITPPSTMRDMVCAVADHLGVARMKIIKHHRHLSVVNTRHLLFLLIRVLLKKSSPEIGIYFRRDHTTVLHAFRRYPWALRQLQQHTDLTRPLYELIDHTCLLMRIEARLHGRRQPQFLSGH